MQKYQAGRKIEDNAMFTGNREKFYSTVKQEGENEFELDLGKHVLPFYPVNLLQRPKQVTSLRTG